MAGKGYGYGRYRRQGYEPSAKPQITSFADVTLVLLVIFLVSASAAIEMVSVSLPDAKHAASRDINLAVTISVSNDLPTHREGSGTTDRSADERPAADAPEMLEESRTTPWLFYFEDDTTGVEAKNLWTALKAIKGGGEWPIALVRADIDTPCAHVAILIQCLEALGVEEIAFVMKTEGNRE
jgi:biopolymer transport protein ExbD